MHLYKNIGFRIFFSLIFIPGVFSSLKAQETTRFSGPVAFGDFRGVADFLRDTTNGDTLLEGYFRVNSFQPSSLFGEVSSYHSMEGYIFSKRPDSTWKFQFGDLYADGEVKLENNHLKVKISGIQHRVLAKFRKGKAHGEWSHIVQIIDSSSVKETLFQSQGKFLAGLPQGSIRMENEHTTLLGRFLRNGFAHDTWELGFIQEEGRGEEWRFSEGRLEKILVWADQAADSLAPYPDQISQLKIINLDKRFFRILDLQNKYDSLDYIDMGGKILGLIAENASYNQRVENSLKALGSSIDPGYMPTFKVKVAHFPLDKSEKVQVQGLADKLSKVDSISQALLSSTRLNILKHSDEEVLYGLSIVKEIKENYLSPVRKVIGYAKEDLIDFLPRENLRPPLRSGQEAFTDIPVEYQDSNGVQTRIFVGPIPQNIDLLSSGFAFLSDLSSYSLACVDSLNEVLNKKLKNQKYYQELEDLEKDLLVKEDSLIAFIDRLNDSLPEPYKPAMVALQSTIKSELGIYSEEEDLALKLSKGKEIMQCMDSLEALSVLVSELPDKRKDMEKLYTQQVWNPFTATIMKDQVKERVLAAYDRLLIPSFLKKLEMESSCAKTQQFQQMLKTLHLRMKELRKQNTSKLERKLKNEDDPEIVMQLFEISL